jgi:hypothetical protein
MDTRLNKKYTLIVSVLCEESISDQGVLVFSQLIQPINLLLWTNPRLAGLTPTLSEHGA